MILILSARTLLAEGGEVKTGWTQSTLPCVSWSTDNGFQYGAFGEVYCHADGSTYPDPRHKFLWELSHYTKGRTRAFLAYDSKYLVPGMRLGLSCTFIHDPFYEFFGFNGAASDASGHYRRSYLRVRSDFQGRITDSFQWAAGLGYWHHTVSDGESIYTQYNTLGLVRGDEASGGDIIEVNCGFVWDTRDVEAAPGKGIWSEFYITGAHELKSGSYTYAKLNAHWRHYVTVPLGFIKAGDPVFAYHLAYQGTVAGDVPFYMQQNISCLIVRDIVTEGLGSFNSIRGLFANRLIGDGYAWGNFELRVKLVRFQFLKQYFYIAANPFYDCGAIVQPYRSELMSSVLPAADMGRASEFVQTAGAGIKIAWNENFILSIECARCFNRGLGPDIWMSANCNYSF